MKTCMPPDPNVHAPAFKLPPKAMLAHLHSVLGIERAVIVQASCHGTDNRATLDAIASSNGRYRGVAIVDDSFDDRQAEALHAGGIRGVRFNFVQHLGGVPDLDVFHRTLDRITPLGWHVVLHLDAGDLIEFRDMLHGLKLPFVIDHMGRVKAGAGLDQPPFQALLELMKHDNAWVKVCGSERVSTAGPPFTDSAPFAAALVEAAPDRVLWGTDWPHPNIAKHMPNDADLVDLIPRFAPDADQQHRLLVTNPERLYDFAD